MDRSGVDDCKFQRLSPRRVIPFDSTATRSGSSTPTLLTSCFRSKPSSGKCKGEKVNKIRLSSRLSRAVTTLKGRAGRSNDAPVELMRNLD